MRKELPAILSHSRIRDGSWGSDDSYGPSGAFIFHRVGHPELRVIASDGDGTGWEHVSVSLATRIPTWLEMSWVKDLFWGDNECVIQYHPPKENYINYHPFCLHLWKPPQAIPLPPTWMVGPKK